MPREQIFQLPLHKLKSISNAEKDGNDITQQNLRLYSLHQGENNP